MSVPFAGQLKMSPDCGLTLSPVVVFVVIIIFICIYELLVHPQN